MEKRTRQFVLYMHKVGALSLKCTFNFGFCTMLGPSRISARPRFIKIHGKQQQCQIYIADQTLINSSESVEKSRRGEINIHGELEGCQIYRADQLLIGNCLAAKTLHQSHQGCDGEPSGGGGGGGGGEGAMATGAAILVVAAVFGFDFAGVARAWTRETPWYLPCGEVVCVVLHEFVACVCV